jgi:tetratricopeptide (TPR) repeat protein
MARRRALWDELLLALYAQADWLLSQGELEQAVQRGEQILALVGEQPSLPVALARRILGMSRLFQARFPEARQHLDGALATPTQPGIAAGLARIYRLHGELLLRQETPDRRAAEAHFEQALDIARQQGAYTLALRAALSLAKLWQATQPEAARRLLAAAYAWFTEGLDTPDLREAAALLDVDA